MRGFDTGQRRVVNRRVFSLFAFAVLILAGAAGCGHFESESPIIIGANTWPGYTPLFLAENSGRFPSGRIRIAEHGNTSHVLLGLRNGVLHGAALTLDEAIAAREEGLDLVVIAVLDISRGADAVLAPKGTPANLKALEGCTVGAEVSALGAYMLARALERGGLEETSVRIVPCALDEQERAFTEGAIDAVVTFDPVRTRLLRQGAVTLFSSADIPGEIVDVLVVRESLVRERPAAIRELLDGWAATTAILNADPGTYHRLAAPLLGVEPAEVNDLYRLLEIPDLAASEALLAGTRPKLRETAERLQEIMLSRGLITGRAPLDGLIPSAGPRR